MCATGSADLEPHGTRPNAWLSSREAISFPDYYKAQESASPRAKQVQMACTSPLTYKGQAALKTELDNLKDALKGLSPAEVFVPCISPANIEDWNENKYYKTNEEYLTAIADAMSVEYKTIVDAGFLVQVDDPRLVSYYLMDPKMSVDDIRKWAMQRVEALNHALRGIPTEKIRYHTCYSINMGPRVHDLEVKHIIDILTEDPRRRLLVRSVQSAPRARMGGVEGGEAAGGHGAHPGRHHQLVGAGRASRAGRAADRPLCRFHGPRERHRRNGLRICEFRRLRRGSREHRLGQVRRAGEGRGNRQQEALALTGRRAVDRAVFVYTTWPTVPEAEEAGRTLVERHLAACVNILPGMISHYRWQGEVERGEEAVMIIKTRASLADQVSDAVKELHSYETPAIVVLPVESVEKTYLAWLLEGTDPKRVEFEA